VDLPSLVASAVSTKEEQFVEMWLKHWTPEDGHVEPLCRAAALGNEHIMDRLLQHGAKGADKALVAAAAAGMQACVPRLLEQLEEPKEEAIEAAKEAALGAGAADIFIVLCGGNSDAVYKVHRIRWYPVLGAWPPHPHRETDVLQSIIQQGVVMSSVPPVPPLHGRVKFVATKEDLDSALLEIRQVLETCPVLGLDVEYYSCPKPAGCGFVCLLQLATIERSYVLDALALREEMYGGLADLFLDPGVTKVGHGTSSDLRWLRADFHIFVVNLFDTYLAANTLGGYDGDGLKHLVGKHFGIALQKEYQRSDWRIRPLPAPMLEYAATDAHYLPHLYVRMASALSQQSRLADVLTAGHKACVSDAKPLVPLHLVFKD